MELRATRYFSLDAIVIILTDAAHARCVGGTERSIP